MHGMAVIVTENRLQILVKAVCISLHSNVLREGMNPPTVSKLLFIIGMAISLTEGKL